MHSQEKLLQWQHDKEFQLEQIKKDAFSIKRIRNPDKEIQLEAIKRAPICIKYISNPDKEVQLEAIKEVPICIQYLHDPDKDIMIEALDNNSEAIVFIDIEEHPEIYNYYVFLNK